MGSAGPIAQLLGGAVGAYGQIFQGEAQSNAYKYNAAVARENAFAAQQNAQLAAESGTAQAAQVSLHTKQVYGSTKASQAASGVDVNSGSAVQVRASEKELGNLDAYNSRVAAVREAYGFQVQEANFKGESALDEFQAENAKTASYFGAASTLLGSMAQAGNDYTSWQMASGGFGA